NVADEIEIEIVIKGRVPRVSRTSLQQRVAIRRSAHDRFGGEIAACARPVLDDKGLTEALRQPLAYQACVQVRHAARRKSNNQAHRPRWISMCPSDARDGWQRGSARCQMQKISTGKFHFEPPSHHSITPSALCWRNHGTSRPSALAAFRLITS